MVYGYARVSTKGQAKDGNSLEAQEKALREAGAQQIFKDAFTGTKSDRPSFNKVMELLNDGDMLIVSKLDRFARNAEDAIRIIRELVERGVIVNILNMGKADRTPMGKLMITILSGFAEFERDMIVERMREGKETSGNYGGRKKAYTSAQVEHALNLLDTHSYKQVEQLTGISKSTLIRRMKEKKELEN